MADRVGFSFDGFEFKHAYARAVNDTKKNLARAHAGMSAKLYKDAEQLFTERTGSPPWSRFDRSDVSVTRGGMAYRERSRATGRFTFGPGGAFQARHFREESGAIQGISWPDPQQADKYTRTGSSQGAWRALEFGLSAVTMPGGLWADSNGNITRRTDPAYNIFWPAKNKGMFMVGGITPKYFLRDSFTAMIERAPREYNIVIQQSWRGWLA